MRLVAVVDADNCIHAATTRLREIFYDFQIAKTTTSSSRASMTSVAAATSRSSSSWLASIGRFVEVRIGPYVCTGLLQQTVITSMFAPEWNVYVADWH